MRKLNQSLVNIGRSIRGFVYERNRKSGKRRSTTKRSFRRIGFDCLESRKLLTGDLLFAAGLGGSESDNSRDLVTDSLGNVYSTGSFSGTADFDPGLGTYNLTAVGLFDAFISKLDNAGNFVWAKALTGVGDAGGNGIAIDFVGNVYTMGNFSDTVDFDPNAGTYNLTSKGNFDVFISKLDSNGNFVSAKALGGTNWDYGNSIGVDADGNIYAAGRFSGTADFDPGVSIFSITSAGSDDAFVAKLDSTGNFVWARAVSGTLDQESTDIAVDGSGNVYTTGYYFGTTDFDPGSGVFNIDCAGNSDAFISKLDSAGNFVWAKSLSGPGSESGQSIAIDSSGNVLTTGYFESTLDFDPNGRTNYLTSAGNADAYISKLDNAGNFVWAKAQSSSTSVDGGFGITLDGSGNVYTTGYFWGIADFDPGVGVYSLISAGVQDAFVSKLDSAGNFLWAKALGGSFNEVGKSIALDRNGNVFTTGYFEGIADFDPNSGTYNLTSAGFSDAFVAKLTQEFILTTPITGAADWVLRRNGSYIQVFDKQTNKLVSQRVLNLILGVQINGASSADNLTIDFQFGGMFSLPNGIRFDGSTGTDSLKVKGSGTQLLVVRPTLVNEGITQIEIDNSTIAMSRVESISVNKLRQLKIETQGSKDTLTVAPGMGMDGLAASLISGVSDGIAITPLTWNAAADVVIDTATNDRVDLVAPGAANDGVTFAAGSLDAVGMKNLTIDMGKGADILTVVNADLGLPVAGGSFWFYGGAGIDRLAVTGDADMRLNDTRLVSSSGGRILIDDVEKATLTGGASNNLLTAVGFSGSVILNGGNGNDILRGAEGNDSLIGGNGNDLLFGYDGDDSLDGGANDDQIFGGDGNDILLGGLGNDMLSGQAGNDALNGQGGSDLLQFEGTNNAESLNLQFLSATTAQFVRKPRGLNSTLEKDTITNDAADEVSIQALGGDDLIAIDLAITMLGVVDGGDGTDSCTAPAGWTKISC